MEIICDARDEGLFANLVTSSFKTYGLSQLLFVDP